MPFSVWAEANKLDYTTAYNMALRGDVEGFKRVDGKLYVDDGKDDQITFENIETPEDYGLRPVGAKRMHASPRTSDCDCYCYVTTNGDANRSQVALSLSADLMAYIRSKGVDRVSIQVSDDMTCVLVHADPDGYKVTQGKPHHRGQLKITQRDQLEVLRAGEVRRYAATLGKFGDGNVLLMEVKA